MKKGLLVIVILTVGAIPLVAEAEYGAIAYSPSTGKCGYSTGYGSSSSAIRVAEANCGESDCVWKVWFRNSCGSLARAENGAIGYSQGFSNIEAAKQRALNECSQRGSKCQLRCWACSGNRNHRRR